MGQSILADSIAPTSWLTEFTDFAVARVLVTVAGLALLVWSARTQPAPLSFGVAVMVSMLIVPTIYAHYLALAILPLVLLVGHSRSALAPVAEYLALFIGGQAALGDLGDPLIRATATTGALVVLIALVWPSVQVAQAALRAPAPRAAETAAPSS